MAVQNSQRRAHLVSDLTEQSGPTGLGLGQGGTQGPQACCHLVQLGRAWGRHLDGIPASSQLGSGAAELLDRAQESVCREQAERAGSQDAHEGTDQQGLVNRGSELVAKHAALAHARSFAHVHLLVEHLRRKGADEEHGGESAHHHDGEMGEQEAGRQSVHGDGSGSRRSL